MYDLAIAKNLLSTPPFMQGTQLTYEITIANEGSLDAADIQVTDIPELGLNYVSSNAMGNANVSETSNGVWTITSLPFGSTETIEVTFEIDPMFMGATLRNDVEITLDNGDDVDSDPATSSDVDEDGDGNGDDDDEDFVLIPVGQVYDLAIDKNIITAGPYQASQQVTYEIIVTNEGSLDAANVVLTDTPDFGLNYVSSNAGTLANVTESLDGIFTVASLPQGASESIEITFEIDPDFMGTSLINAVEITTDDGDDFDSNPATSSDVDEDGDGNGDDDDEDEVEIAIEQIYDLAIDKNILSSAPYMQGSQVTYEIIVTNEGSLDAANVEITDNPDTGLNYVSSNAGANVNVTESSSGIWVVADLPVGSSETIEVTFEIDAMFMGTSLTNAAEITNDDGDDVDSDPATSSDVDEDMDGNGDDDDEDEVTISLGRVVDLSLDKALAAGQDNEFGIFEDVYFEITVTNEGSIDAYDVEIVDYLPIGLMLSPNDNNGWGTNLAGDLTNSLSNPVLVGQSQSITLVARVTEDVAFLNLSQLTNVAEIIVVRDDQGDLIDDSDSSVDNNILSEDDQDDETIVIPELDPTGIIYCDKTGRIVTGGTITVSGPGPVSIPNDSNGVPLDGRNGYYQYFVQVPGVYTITYNHPDGFPVSNNCNVQAGILDATISDGQVIDLDGALNGTIVLGQDAIGDSIVDVSCGLNSYFSMIEIEPNDPPLITLNNIPVSCVTIQSTLCEGNTDPIIEAALSNSTVDLFACSDLVNPIETINLSADGFYGFDGLIAGCYRLRFNIVDGFGIETNTFVDAMGWTEDITTSFGDCIENNEFCIGQTAELGNFVWVDLNSDGLFDLGEPSVPNVVVNLLDASGNILETTTTDINGEYLFTDLMPGDYRVQFDISGLPVTYGFTGANAGDDTLDSDANQNGISNLVTLNAGDSNLDVDAGLIVLSSLGNFVWHDLDGDGIQDGNEPGLENVRVELRNRLGFLVDIMLTDSNGFYLFEELTPGDYYVTIVYPEGFTATLANQGTNDGNDNDVDNSNGEGSTAIINLSAGENDLSLDAGLYQCILIGDNVWFDYDEDDIFDATENGINGMLVQLYRNENNSWVLADEQYTGHKPGTPSDDGYFKFCARPGRYYLRFVNPPETLVPARPNRGNNEELDSDVTNRFGAGTTDEFTVVSGDEKCDLGAGYYKMGSIGDFIWMDDNGNGMRESNEVGVADVVVRAINLDGEVMATTVSDENGNYTLDYLGKDYYYIHFNVPTYLYPTSPNMGSDDSVDSDLDNSHGEFTTNIYSVGPGDHIHNVDAGLMFGVLPVEWLRVWGENRSTHNYIEWNIGTESNVSHYEVERSLNGISEFEMIGKVLAEGNAITTLTYSYNDYNNAEAGKYYYRIKQYDLNGAVDYSEIVIINQEDTNRREVSASIYPNPVVDVLTVELDLPSAVQNLSANVYDAAGKLVWKGAIIDTQVELGMQRYSVDVVDLPSGVYTMRLRMDNKTIVKKLIVTGN